MRKLHFIEEQIIGILHEQERGLKTAEGLQEARDQPQYVCKWKSKFGGMDVSDSRKLKMLEIKNAR